jgi:hypothetical protein
VSERPEIPLYGSEEGRTAEIVRCRLDDSHIASRVAFENEGGCPYCLRTQEQRIAALSDKETRERRARNGR